MPGNAAMTIFIGGDNSDFLKKWESTKRALKKGFGREAMDASAGVAMGLAGVAAAMGVMGIASVKMAAEMQANKRAFSTLLGDSQQAEKFLGDLAKFAAETPFELPGLVTASKKLLAFGFAAQDIIPMMAAIGDAAAMLGMGQEGIDRLTLALGQMQAKGKVSGEEMRQLAEAGIPAWKFLADAIGKSIPEAMDMSEKGLIDGTTGINAILMGMQTKFKGGMDGLSKEIPGLMSTIKDNTAAVAREIGDKIIAALDIKDRMQSLANYLGNFANYVKANGINDALRNMVPKELSAAIFIVAGALAGAAVPALVAFAVAAWSAIVPLLPFIAAGAALGAVAWVIWQAWEPLGDLFINTWDRAAAWTQQKWAEIKLAVFSGVQKLLEAMIPLANLFGGGLQRSVSGWLSDLSEKVATAGQEAAAAAERGKTASEGINKAFEGIGNSLTKGAGDIAASASGLDTTFKGLTNVGGNAGAGAKEAAKEWEKLEKKAAQVSEAIEKQWVQTTKTELEQLDIWRAEQLKDLEETKAANENYQRDLLRVEATYSARRRKILEDDARNILSIQRQITDNAREFSQFNIKFNLKGSAAKEFDIWSGATDKIRDMEREFEDLSSKWNTATETEKNAMRQAFIDNGILFKETEDGKISFAEEAARRRVAIYGQAEDDIADYRRSSEALQDDLDVARRQGNVQAFAAMLAEERAIQAQDLAGRQEYMSAYYESWKAIHRNAMSYMAEAMSTTFSGLQTFFADALSQTKSWGDAWKALGNTFKKMMANWVAEWIAGQISMAIFGKVIQAQQVAAAVVAGAATAAAWAPAAAMVSLATMGGNAAPAAAGIAATVGLALGLSAAGGSMPSMGISSKDLAGMYHLADGGITTGPTLATIGEGFRNEVVLPLDRKVFEKMGLTSGTSAHVEQNIYGDINTKADTEEIMEDLGMMCQNAVWGAV